MPIPSVKHGRPNRRRNGPGVLTSTGEHSGVIGLVVDPEEAATRKIVQGAFGDAGLECLRTMQAALPGGFVAMVGRIRREPARIGAFFPDGTEEALDAVWAMARHLGDNSCWIVNLPGQHQGAVMNMLAMRTETAGPMQ